ncbi:hypothetical protein AMTR_s00058p00117500 [Amborella trichopoda]|uniref:U1-type domain-containing protein n=2 Tax=Amborella trichopoda TaxID=13333 RepID=W1PHF8_AMBTC|nr:hypothetical protein AMTR_s00058p00117500 [Amborella trichopoda]
MEHLKQHKAGKKHKEKLEEMKELKRRGMGAGALWCKKCGVPCSNKVAMEQHLSGKRHIARIQELKAQRENESKIDHSVRLTDLSVSGEESLEMLDSHKKLPEGAKNNHNHQDHNLRESKKRRMLEKMELKKNMDPRMVKKEMMKKTNQKIRLKKKILENGQGN